MSYDIDANGEKIFYEEDHKVPMDFDNWLETFTHDLEHEYIEDNPELFPTDDSMCEIWNIGDFQQFCEDKYNDYLNNFPRHEK